MTRKHRLLVGWAVVFAMVVIGVPRVSVAQDTPASGVEIEADRLLFEMSEYLAAADEFSFRVEISYDVVASTGEILEYSATHRVAVRRPDGFHVVVSGDEFPYRVVFDGETTVFLRIDTNLYSVFEGGSDIDTALDYLFEKAGVSVPISDVVYSDPYEALIVNVESGTRVGLHSVDGHPTHHLAFQQQVIDWQVWIDDGPRPLPRKLVLTYKDEPGKPRYRARFDDWDFEPRFSDHFFEFRPPAGAIQIEVLPATREEGSQ